MRRNCSETIDFREAAADLTERFRNRGYPRKLVGEAFQVANRSSRENLLTPKVRTGDTQIRLITRFNNQWSDLYKVLQSNWHIFTVDPRLSTYITNKPQMVARRAPNIKDQLVRSHCQRPTTGGTKNNTTGTYPCGNVTYANS